MGVAVINIPLNALRARLDELPEGAVQVVCAVGKRAYIPGARARRGGASPTSPS